MKKIFLLLILLASIFFAFELQSQNIKYVHKVVRDLGMPNMYGRSVFKNGDSIAADYIAKEFTKYKLKPMIDNKYYQSFIISNTALEAVFLEFGSKGNLLRPDDDYYILGFSPSVDIELENVKPILINDLQH
jgi:hypothetical protein